MAGREVDQQARRVIMRSSSRRGSAVVALMAAIVGAIVLAGCAASADDPGPPGPTTASMSVSVSVSVSVPLPVPVSEETLALPDGVERGSYGPWRQDRVGTSLAPDESARRGAVTFQCAGADDVTLEMSRDGDDVQRHRVSCGNVHDYPMSLSAGQGISVSAVGRPGEAAQYAIGFRID